MEPDEKARAIFAAHNGEKYFMALDGTLDEYKSFNISKDTESEWRLGMIAEGFVSFLYNEFNLNSVYRFHDLVQLLNAAKEPAFAAKAIRYLQENIDKYDSFGSILLLESAFQLIERMDGNDMRALCRVLVSLNGNLKNRPHKIREMPESMSAADVSVNAVNRRIDSLDGQLQALLKKPESRPATLLERILGHLDLQ